VPVSLRGRVKATPLAWLPVQPIPVFSGSREEDVHMKTMRIYRLTGLSPMLFCQLKAVQQEAALVWNVCMEARIGQRKWPGQRGLEQATRGWFVLNARVMQRIVHAFLANVETTRSFAGSTPQCT
jgi:hypothetical protein